MSKSVLKYILVFFCIVLKVYAKPIGWYNEILISKNVIDFNIAKKNDNYISGAFFESSKSFVPNSSYPVTLKYIEFKEVKNNSIEIADIVLPPGDTLFYTGLVIDQTKDKIMIAWQEPSHSNFGTIIKYVVADKKDKKFSKPVILSKNNYNLTQPHVYGDDSGVFYLILEQRDQANKFSFVYYRYIQDKFEDALELIKNVNSIGKGAFFPAVITSEGNIDILYQSRQSDILTDELFLTNSQNSGKNFSSAKRITENKHNDFAPAINRINGNLEWVWQSDEPGFWQIYIGGEKLPVTRITSSNANCYSPVISFSQKNGHLVVWQDHRKIPPQIYGKFTDKVNNEFLFSENPVTDYKTSVQPPNLVTIKDQIYLIYTTNNLLYLKKVDSETSPISISSNTHPENTPVKSNNVKMNITVNNEPSEVKSYAYLIDNRPDSVPDLYNLDGGVSKFEKSGLSGGEYFLHIRYQDKADNISPVFHYRFLIDLENPSTPEIQSSTHPENSNTTATDVQLTFRSVDDLGVKGYMYTFSTNRGAVPDLYTEKNEVVFNETLPGKYYFLVQAIDQAGNSSPIAAYPVNVVYPDYEDFYVTNNIVDGRMTSDILNFEFTLNKKNSPVKTIYALFAGKSEKFLDLKNIVKFKTENKSSKISIEMKDIKYGLQTFMFMLVYEDDSKSTLRKYYFEYTKSGSFQSTTTGYSLGKGLTISKNILYADNSEAENLRPDIHLNIENGIYKISFSMKNKYRIQGYSYQISDYPGMPDGKLNYVKTPVYLYNLNPGIYYLSVMPVLKAGSRQSVPYSFIQFEVTSTDLFISGNYFIIILAFFLLIILWILKNRIYYFLHRFQKV